jgi:GTP-binding protein
VILTSAATGAGLTDLGRELLARVPPLPQGEKAIASDGLAVDAAELAEHRTYRPAADIGYEIERLETGRWRVSGRGVARLVARYDLDNDEALAYLERRLERIGVVQALERRGFQPGDEVEIAGVAFELHPEV